ncbi:(Fe-S)-binding protein [Lysobacter sp. S4-A87]|uniref:(Fe-S)-binding protein n=1 Tax=Lysobacter sp. S4-A87 TaxID=2925843 RepID=UPI001F5351BA|nr:(Fe-S)-binding protein [Lysobacter sp. S4-A87]UNK48867.1 (Fe-S)-binding protein [Lysobacter sp. S4-A87]
MPAAFPPPALRQADPLVALADRCVQCGLCLPACPTYGQARIESESPRGRIALVRAWAVGTIEATDSGEAHLDHCLGCRSCESVCPAGVQYGQLLTQARARQRQRRAPAWQQRWIEALAGRPRLLEGLLDFYRLAHPWLPARLRRLPAPPPALHREARPHAETSVALFAGCVARPYESALRRGLIDCFAALGVEIAEPTAQTCCGSLHAHAGNEAAASALARKNRDAFAGADTVLTLASGCHESVATSLDGQSRVVDAIEYLEEQVRARAPDLRWRRCDERVALHLPCTQRNVVRSVASLRRLLAAVPGLQVIELDRGLGCCGAAGVQMLGDPQRAGEFRAPLLQQLSEIGATRLLSANIGCRLHLAAAASVPVQHPLEFLAGLVEVAPSSVPPAASG